MEVFNINTLCNQPQNIILMILHVGLLKYEYN